jgi:hypothetical protein
MLEVLVWFVALVVAIFSGAFLVVQLLMRRRATLAVAATTLTLVSLYCLIGADSHRVAPGPGVAADWNLLFNCGVLALTLGAVALTLLCSWWFFKSPVPLQRYIGLVLLLAAQVSTVGWVGWRFNRSTAPTDESLIDGSVNMDEIADEALLTDKQRLVPVYRAAVESNAHVFAPGFAGHRIVRADADYTANCHGWVFTGGRHLLKGTGVEMILEDNGYQIVKKPQPGDVIVYRDLVNQIVHTGIVRVAFDDGQVLIESKWGIAGRYLHLAEDQYYSKYFAFYRSPRSFKRTGDQSPHLVQSVKVLPGQRFQMRPESALVNRASTVPASTTSALDDPMTMPTGEAYPIGAE